MGKAPGEILNDATRRDVNNLEIPYGPITFHRDRQAEWAGGQRSGEKGTWPLECIASGVNPAQAPELRKLFKKHNFDCEVSGDGNPIYRDSCHRKRALKLRGFYDKASY